MIIFLSHWLIVWFTICQKRVDLFSLLVLTNQQWKSKDILINATEDFENLQIFTFEQLWFSGFFAQIKQLGGKALIKIVV